MKKNQQLWEALARTVLDEQKPEVRKSVRHVERIREAKLQKQLNKAHEAIRFLMSQVERLAHHAFSDEVEVWLAKNDAMNCGRRATTANTSNQKSNLHA